MKSSVALANHREVCKAAREALKQYGLTDISLRLVGDVHNIVFRVQARPRRAKQRRQYALRLHIKDWLSDAAIESEMAWLETLRRETPLLVPHPVRNTSGELLTKADGGLRTCTLFHWMNGRRYWKRPSAQLLCEIGRLMADLQTHGAHFKRPPGFQRPKWDRAAMTGRKGILVEGWDGLPRNAASVLSGICDRFDEAARSIGTGARSFGLIHGDLHVANVLSHNGTNCAIDFDDCCDGYYLSDIAANLDYLEFRENYRELRSAFLAGYCESRPLPAKHAAHINVFLAARWVTVVLYLARRNDKQRQLARVLEILVPKFKKFLRVPESLG